RIDDRRSRPTARRARREEADLQTRGAGVVAAQESYPDDLKYHAEHDWARIQDGEATLGITWSAPDALGELVHYEAPDEGSMISKDESYGEVETVKADSDLISPLSGERLGVYQPGVDAPEPVHDAPDGPGQ